jgi:hypothetical protein
MEPLELIIIIAIIILAIGVIFLQIFLSRKENKWLGLILPLVALCAAFFFTVATPFYVTSSEQTVTVEQTETGSGNVIENVITHTPQSMPDTATMIINAICFFALYNIPTAVLLLIYAACRAKRRKNAQLEKMNIQDL